MTGDATNALVYCPVYESARAEALARCVTGRAHDLAACTDLADVNRIVGNIAPHLVELHRRGWRRNP